jgi:hypothetical protein
MNLGRTPLVFVESLNNWQYDAAIEPATAYGTTYLDIVRQQFKR